MNLKQFARTTTVCTLGLALIGIKDAYGSGAPHGQHQQESQEGLDAHVESETPAQSNSGTAAHVVGVDSVDLVVPEHLHGQGLRVPAKLFKPKWSQKVAKGPAILMLHGSGGLTRMPKGDKKDPCSAELEPQFERWGKRLAERGYVVMMPSSYSARGFCDMHVDTDRIPDDFDDRPEAVMSRLYDVDAASRLLCDRPEVDCDRMGVMGFSHGATMTMMALHWQMDHAIDQFRERAGDELDIDLPDLEPGRPEFQVGVAYYPGCGTDGVVPLDTGADASDYDKYFPSADLYILHAGDDPLVDLCSTKKGSGVREKQSHQVAAHLGVDDTYHIEVYPHSDHGFDNAGSDGGDEHSDSSGDVAARDKALKVALKQIATHLN